MMHLTVSALSLLATLAMDDPREGPAPHVDVTEATPIDPASYQVEVLATGLSQPWNISWLPGGDMLVAERSGDLRVMRDGTMLDAPVDGVPAVFAQGQAGLFEVSPHPDYAENGWLYLTYATGDSNANTLRLARAKFEETPDGGRLTDLEVLFTADAERRSTHHYGGRMQWMPDGTLMLTSGEGSSRRYRVKAQSLDTHFGKILRFNADGSIPDDNPFVGDDDAEPAIWSYGHRNPQGIALAADGTLYNNEHGPRGGDEINIVKAGDNYGWPAISYGIDYSGSDITPYAELPNMEQPEMFWTPSIAPSSLVYYDGDAFPELEGKLLSGALAYAQIVISDPDDLGAPEMSMLAERDMRVRDIAVGPDGHLYVATETRRGSGGEILRILPQQ